MEFKDLEIGDMFARTNGNTYIKIKPEKNCCAKSNAKDVQTKKKVLVNDFEQVTKVENPNEVS